MIYLSVPFALLLGVVAARLPRRSVNGKGSLLFAVLAGTVISLVYIYFVIRFSLVTLGFAILLLSWWVPSGVSAMLMATRGKRIPDLMGIAVLCLFATFLTEPIFNAFTHNQQLTVAVVTPSDASTAQLAADPEALGFDTTAEIQTAQNDVFEYIRALGYRDDFRILSLSRRGKGKNSLAIVVVRTGVTKDVKLPEPDGSTVAYVQHSDKWEKKPPDVATLRRSIEMTTPFSGDSSLGYFAIPDAQGVSLMGRITGRVSDQLH